MSLGSKSRKTGHKAISRNCRLSMPGAAADLAKTCASLPAGGVHPTYSLSIGEYGVPPQPSCNCGHECHVPAGGSWFGPSLEPPGANGTPWMFGDLGTCLPRLCAALDRTYYKDDLSQLPTHSEANPTTLLLLAHICAALDSVPEWLQWRKQLTPWVWWEPLEHAGGLMLPISTRTPGVNYTSSVAVRYSPLNRQIGERSIVGTHSSGGLAGLVGGYQLVIWKTIQGISTCQRSGPLIGNWATIARFDRY